MSKNRRFTIGRVISAMLVGAAIAPITGFTQTPAAADTSSISATALAEIDDHIARNFSAMKITTTVRDATGRSIDCVDLHSQPAARQALLAGQQIQMAPSAQLRSLLPGPVAEQAASPICPLGSVPVRTPTRAEIIKSGSLHNFLSKYPQDMQSTRANGVPPTIYGHEYANVGAYVDNIAAQSTFNIWKPATDDANQFSLTQLWIVGGTGGGLQTIEIGSQVYPWKYGDNLPHLFIYYTADSYQSTGCYNLDCGVFVQTNSSVTIGGALTSYSVAGGTQVEGTVAFYRDPATGNWILFTVNGGVYTQIGYYPISAFRSGQLTQYAQRIDFGGEVYVPTGGSHSGTDMGSGAFGTSNYGQAAYQRNLQYMNRSSVIQNYAPAWINETNHNCYSLWQGWNSNFGNHIYFGGPGKNALCP